MPNIKILIVEDEAIIAINLKKKLERLGYEVVAIVPSGEEAIEKTAQMRPDVVLINVILQGDMDGMEAAEQIYAHFNIPVIHVTALGDDITLQRIKGSTSFGYILKPFEENELRTTIEMALCKHKMGWIPPPSY